MIIWKLCDKVFQTKNSVQVFISHPSKCFAETFLKIGSRFLFLSRSFPYALSFLTYPEKSSFLAPYFVDQNILDWLETRHFFRAIISHFLIHIRTNHELFFNWNIYLKYSLQYKLTFLWLGTSSSNFPSLHTIGSRLKERKRVSSLSCSGARKLCSRCMKSFWSLKPFFWRQHIQRHHHTFRFLHFYTFVSHFHTFPLSHFDLFTASISWTRCLLYIQEASSQFHILSLSHSNIFIFKFSHIFCSASSHFHISPTSLLWCLITLWLFTPSVYRGALSHFPTFTVLHYQHIVVHYHTFTLWHFLSFTLAS